MGRVLVAVAIASWVAGVGVPVTDADTGADLGVASILLPQERRWSALCCGGVSGPPARRCSSAWRRFGGWLLLLFYALAADTP